MSVKSSWICACCGVFAVGLAWGGSTTTVVSQPFASATTDLATLDPASSWSGYGAVTNNETALYVKPAGVGSPINNSTDKNVLTVDGYVTCTAATTANKPATVDMMIQIARPDEALELPSSETTANIQVAVGVETNGTLMVYCRNRAGTAGWYSLGTAAYAEGDWHRVSFTFDYGAKMCQVRVDGEPMMTANGYITTNAVAEAAAGSWYKLNTEGAAALASVKVIGSTAIDEVVMQCADDVADVRPALADAEETTGGVKNSWIEKQGITRAQVDSPAPDGSGMTSAQKYLVGFDVSDGQKFEMKKMTMGGGNVTITHPKFTPIPGKTVKIAYGTTEDCTGGKVAVGDEGSTAISFDGSSNVFYYKLVVE